MNVLAASPMCGLDTGMEIILGIIGTAIGFAGVFVGAHLSSRAAAQERNATLLISAYADLMTSQSVKVWAIAQGSEVSEDSRAMGTRAMAIIVTLEKDSERRKAAEGLIMSLPQPGAAELAELKTEYPERAHEYPPYEAALEKLGKLIRSGI